MVRLRIPCVFQGLLQEENEKLRGQLFEPFEQTFRTLSAAAQ